MMYFIRLQVPVIANVNQAIATSHPPEQMTLPKKETNLGNPWDRRVITIHAVLCVDTTVEFEHTEDGLLMESATPAIAFDAYGSEVRHIHYDLARGRRLQLMIYSTVITDAS